MTAFWWARGRWEHSVWLQWIVLPAFAINGDHVWALWKEWLGDLGDGIRKNLWWFGLFSLMEWQFWVTGIRTGDWWGGAGSGKDLVLLTIVISSFVLLARDAQALALLWRAIVGVGFVAIVVSAIQFYSHYGISEERFRLVWRYAPGFDAVTTGILVGFVLVCATGPWVQKIGSSWRCQVALAALSILLGAALAASESRGAFLAVVFALIVSGLQKFCNRTTTESLPSSRPAQLTFLLLPPVLGYLAYWLLALRVGESSGDLVKRGSAGRFEIYQTYLSQLSPLDWVFGKGHVPSLPAEELGWFVHHPHSAYLGQLVGYGLLGLVVFVVMILTALWKMRRAPELPLLIFGLVAGLFDGGQIITLFSLARWEILVILVPLVVGMARLKTETPSGSAKSC